MTPIAPCSCTDCSATKRAHLPILALAPEAARLRATGSASAISAARNAIDRASSQFIAISASRWRITWLADNGCPNCFRILVYSSVWSSSVCMMPTASAPSAAIARSTTASTAGSASVPSPSRASAARRTSLSSRLQARPPPSRGKSRLTRPCASAGTRNRHNFPPAPLSAPIRAETMICPAALPSSTATLFPLRIHPSAVFLAEVATSARSNRAARSEWANAR